MNSLLKLKKIESFDVYRKITDMTSLLLEFFWRKMIAEEDCDQKDIYYGERSRILYMCHWEWFE